MNKSPLLKQNQQELPGESNSSWFVTVGSEVPCTRFGYDCQTVGRLDRSRSVFLSAETDSAPTPASAHGCGVMFDGVLFNRADLQRELGEFAATLNGSDADVILVAYRRWGEGLLKRLRGAFALLIWDTERELLLCLRDPLGTYPMFYALTADGLVASTSIEVLTQQPGVSRDLNRAALADFFLDRHPNLEETFFQAVKRVPPGHVLRFTRRGLDSYRYWDPAPDGVVEWLKADEVEQFDEFLDRAVQRCLSFGAASIFLSGGLDSVSVAAAAIEQSQAVGLPKPMALSLVFPEPGMSEEVIQRGVATQLGLPQLVKPFYDALGSNQLVQTAVELSASLSAPLLNAWSPAYYGLALEGKRRGFQTVLTGNGGDEWLTISPYLAADLMRSFKFADVFRLWQSVQRSNRLSKLVLMRNLVWQFGAQSLLVPPLHRLVTQIAPGALTLRRRMFPDVPDWLAPDASLRAELKQRREEYAVNKRKTSQGSTYLREMRKTLDHPLISWEFEEYFSVYRRAGLRVLHPYWDADLVDLLYRTPPFMLDQGGRTKGLVRSCLARKFPQLGFDRQSKMGAGSFYASSIYKEATSIWRELGSAHTLAELGIVDEPALRRFMDGLLGREQKEHAYRVWSVLNLEAWARAHVS